MSNPDLRWWEPHPDGGYRVKPVIRYGELPDDVQQLIYDLLEGQARGKDAFELAAANLRQGTMLRQLVIPFERFPRWAWGIDNDPRGLEHVEEILHTGLDRLPPVLVYGDVWLDGRHRLAAHVMAAHTEPNQVVRAIDLQDAMPKPVKPRWIKCCCKLLNPE